MHVHCPRGGLTFAISKLPRTTARRARSALGEICHGSHDHNANGRVLPAALIARVWSHRSSTGALGCIGARGFQDLEFEGETWFCRTASKRQALRDRPCGKLNPYSSKNRDGSGRCATKYGVRKTIESVTNHARRHSPAA